LEVEPGLEAKTLFEHLQRTQPERFPDGQLRTLQRRIQQWRAPGFRRRKFSSRSSPSIFKISMPEA
jgi:hypothetical protein